jgi:hypothetical protein
MARRRRDLPPNESDEELPWSIRDPELVRIAWPVLCTCDHCGSEAPGRCGGLTVRVGHLRSRELHWLHVECIATFEPIVSDLTISTGNKVFGAELSNDGGQTWQRYRLLNGRLIALDEWRQNFRPAPPPPAGWLRSRLLGRRAA